MPAYDFGALYRSIEGLETEVLDGEVVTVEAEEKVAKVKVKERVKVEVYVKQKSHCCFPSIDGQLFNNTFESVVF